MHMCPHFPYACVEACCEGGLFTEDARTVRQAFPVGVYVRMLVHMYVTRSINRRRVSKKRYCFLTQSLLPHASKYNVERVLMVARELSQIKTDSLNIVFGGREGRNGFPSFPRALVNKQYLFLDRGVGYTSQSGSDEQLAAPQGESVRCK